MNMTHRDKWEAFKIVFAWAMPWLVIALGLVLACVCAVACVLSRIR
jgi:apolipoprotein N-acyltransferase